MTQAMPLSYPLSAKVFKTEADFQEAKMAVKNKQITKEEIKMMIDISCYTLYNNIISHFFGSEKIDKEAIWTRDSLLNYVNEYESYSAYLLPILINNGLIGVCGRGYTLDSPRWKQSEDNYEKMLEITWHRQLCFV